MEDLSNVQSQKIDIGRAYTVATIRQASAAMQRVHDGSRRSRRGRPRKTSRTFTGDASQLEWS